MGDPIRYGGIDFDSDFRSGTDATGTVIRFTRAERLLLAKLANSAGVVLSRELLLDAISGAGSDSTDRNVDFVISRLRRKLGDAARSPSFVESRYGEGYVWIAKRVAVRAKSSGAFLVLGPVRGVQFTGPFAEQARAFVHELRSLLDRKMASDSGVVIDEACPAAKDYVGEKPRFAAELSFLDTGERLDCAATIKVFASGQIMRVLRCTVAGGDAGGGRLDRKQTDRCAEEIAAAIWDMLAYPASHHAPSEEVLAVRMHSAAELLSMVEPWKEADRRLRAALQRDQHNHQARLMLATNLHSKYLTAGLIPPETDDRARDEEEMETLILSSLPHLQQNPVFMMAAAKLLYFLDRGHRPLALEIAEEAFGTSTAFASSFTVLGQMRMFEGEFEEALALLERGLELVVEGSHFDRYLLTLKCQALLASGDRAGLAAAFDDFCARKPGLREIFSVFYTPGEAGEVLPEAQVFVDNIEERRARAVLVWVHYICARLFRSAEHRANIMRPSAQLFFKRFGRRVLPAEALADLPFTDVDQPERGGSNREPTPRQGARP